MSGKKSKTDDTRDLVLIRIFRGGLVVAWDTDENGDHREVRELRVENFRDPEQRARLDEMGRRRRADGDLFAQGIPGGWWPWGEMLPALRQIYAGLESSFGPMGVPGGADDGHDVAPPPA